MQEKLTLIVIVALFLVAIAFCFLLHLQFGVFETTFAEVAKWLVADDGSNGAFAMREIRIPRALNAIFVGAGLAMSGALIQTLTRNPLGDPGLTGVSAGASFGVAVVVGFITQSVWMVLFGGIAGGLIAATLTFTLALGSELRDIRVILAGVAVSIFFIAATSAIMIVNRSSMQTLYYWMIGGFANKGWAEFSYLWIWVTCTGIISLLLSPTLELLNLDDNVSKGVGFNANLWRLVAGILAVFLAASAVSVAGPIGFIGFVAPHLVRRLIARTPSYVGNLVVLMILSALCGSLLTVFADYAARALPIYNRAPAGVLITLFGGIAFLFMASRTSEGAAQ